MKTPTQPIHHPHLSPREVSPNSLSNLRGPGSHDDMRAARQARAAKDDLLANVRRELVCPLPTRADSPLAAAACDDRWHNVPIEILAGLVVNEPAPALLDLTLQELLSSTGRSPAEVRKLLRRLCNLCAPEPGASTQDLARHRRNTRPSLHPTLTLAWLLDGSARGRRQYAWIETVTPRLALPVGFPFGPCVLVHRATGVNADRPRPAPPWSLHPPRDSSDPSTDDLTADRVGVAVANIRARAAVPREQRPTLDKASLAELRRTLRLARAEMAGHAAVLPWQHMPLRRDFGSCSAALRVDPFHQYHANDEVGAQVTFAREQALMRRRSSQTSSPAEPPTRSLPAHVDEWAPRLLKQPELFIRVLGSVHAHRTLNEQQVRAYVSDHFTRLQVSRMLQSCFEAGLITRSWPPETNTPRVYAPANGDVFNLLAERHLSRAQVNAILGSGSWTGSQSKFSRRHNLLVTELLLRLAERRATRVILGEAFASRLHLAGYGRVDTSAHWAEGRADGVYIGATALPIAIELTTNINQGFRAKIEDWVQYLLESHAAGETAVQVLFVLAPPPDDDPAELRRRNNRMTTSVAGLIAATLHGLGASHVSDRIGLVTWTDWFPKFGQVDVNEFHALSSLGLEPDLVTWKVRNLNWDGEHRDAHKPSHRRAAQLITDHAAHLGQTPRVLAEPTLNSQASRGIGLRRPWTTSRQNADDLVVVAPLKNRSRRPALSNGDRIERHVIPERLRGLER